MFQEKFDHYLKTGYVYVYDAEKCTDDAIYSNAEKCRCFFRKSVWMCVCGYMCEYVCMHI